MKYAFSKLALALSLAIILSASGAEAGHNKRSTHLNATQIQAVQQSLREAGYYSQAPVDGLWGPFSRRALQSYQQDKGLDATGYPDKETITRLGVRFPDEKQNITKNRQHYNQ